MARKRIANKQTKKKNKDQFLLIRNRNSSKKEEEIVEIRQNGKKVRRMIGNKEEYRGEEGRSR